MIARVMLLVTSVLVALGASQAATAQDKRSNKLPILQQAGVIPVQWEGLSDGVTGILSKDRISAAYTKAVQNSARFRLIDSDLVTSQWNSAAGRQELNKQFELHAFLGLNVALKDDTVAFVFRVLGPSLENYLTESDSVSRNWVNSATQSDLDERIGSLVYRTLNRLPVDVTITSVQGKFITLSGGKNQHVEIGDDVTLVRSVVTSRHPANGSWLEFQTKTIGSAKIVESNANTAVAKLTRLVHEGAAEVGDGARVPAIAARNKFKPEPRQPQLVDNGREGMIVPPQPIANDNPNKRIADATPPDAEQEQEDSEGQSLADMLNGKFQHAVVEVGPRLWQISGRGTAKAKFPLWLFNHIGATGYRSFGNNLYGDAGLDLDFGQTSNGSFSGFAVRTKLYYSAPLQTDIGAKNAFWRGGGTATLRSIGINDETYGGMDALMLGGFAGVGGTSEIAADKNLDWYADMHLTPIMFGQAGVRGSKASIKSAFGWMLIAGATLPHDAKDFEWGGEFRYGSQSYSLAGGRDLSESELSILATGRYKF